MELNDINNILRDQMSSLNHLTPPMAFASTIQTIRMGLQILNSAVKTKYEDMEREQMNSIIRLLDSKLHSLLIHKDDGSSDNELSDDDSQCDNCKDKEEMIDPENFSEENKEESDWASSLTSDSDSDEEKKRKVNGKSENDEEEDNLPKWGESEEQIAINEICVYQEDPIECIYGNLTVNDEKYDKFLSEIAGKCITVKAPNKLYYLMELHRESSDNMDRIYLQTMFKPLIEHDCKSFLDEYYA